MKRALIILTVALAGCGSSAPAPTTQEPASKASAATATAALTHNELASALNASCSVEKPKQKRLEREFESAMERNAFPEAGGIYATMMDMVQAHTARISDLHPPDDDRDALRRYISSEKRILGIGARMVRAMKQEDIAQLTRLSSLFTRESNRRLTAAIDLAAEKCGGD